MYLAFLFFSVSFIEIAFNTNYPIFSGYLYDEEIDVLVVDVEDKKSLGHLCASARIVLNCVGPVS
jgi:saccharopine dehydrogenase-like NADP-dependent oxidoreductase